MLFESTVAENNVEMNFSSGIFRKMDHIKLQYCTSAFIYVLQKVSRNLDRRAVVFHERRVVRQLKWRCHGSSKLSCSPAHHRNSGSQTPAAVQAQEVAVEAELTYIRHDVETTFRNLPYISILP